ncbi:hypothetical protein GH714_008066 [Hevea brasiliensis]|uniref:Glycine-rich protein n=1 Tax=Hevea brasiliensis TaxID=3981 RepID=A0A6A6MEG9_HEVBR|nr:hypothetical protein GH714_008066 [Hevea brasiliensis]
MNAVKSLAAIALLLAMSITVSDSRVQRKDLGVDLGGIGLGDHEQGQDPEGIRDVDRVGAKAEALAKDQAEGWGWGGSGQGEGYGGGYGEGYGSGDGGN